MREVLGSGDLSAEPESNEVSPTSVHVEEEKGDEKQRDSDLNDERSRLGSLLSDKEGLVSSSREGTEILRRDGSGDGECGGNGSTGEQDIVRFVDNDKKRRADDEEDDTIHLRKKKSKQQSSDVRVRVSGRLLRSGVVVNKCEEDESNKQENEDNAVVKGEISRDNVDGVVNAQVEESDHSGHKGRKEMEFKQGAPKLSDSNQFGHSRRKTRKRRGRPPKVQSYDQSDGDGGIKLEKRRGRPPKMHENDQSDCGGRIKSKKRPGRPPKVQGTDKPDGEWRIRSEKKRGRPPKVQRIDQADDEERIKLEKRRGRPKLQEGNQSNVGRKKLKRKRGRPPEEERRTEVFNPNLDKGKKISRCRPNENDIMVRDNMGQNLTNFLYLEKIPSGEVMGVKKFLPDRKVNCRDMETEVNQNSMKTTSGAVNAVQFKKNEGKGAKIKKKDGEQSLSEAKNEVRDRIVELLLGAGWTVEYRPRKGREYNDAVYVNPQGKTHWSVTLAYRMFKEQLESCGDNSKASKTGYAFTPISENELSLLKRVVQNQRKDKGKPKQNREGGETAGEVVALKKKHKRKLQKEKLNKEKLKPAVNLYGKTSKGGSSSICKQGDSGGTSQQIVPISGRKHKRQETKSRKPCALLVRNSLKSVESDSDGYLLYEGKRTVLSWMIDLATVPLNGKVQYFNSRKTRVLLEGRIMKEGIQCNCCSEFFTVSGFESHSGSKLRQPFQNLYLETGNSLLQCLVDSWNKQDESKGRGFHFVDFGNGDPNDDTCGICGDGGDLICCDGCPSTFHQSCLDIKKFPSGDWHCVYCTCKFCGMVNVATCQRDADDNIAQSTLCICCLCEEKYHPSCIQEEDAANDNQSRMSYCGKKCQELFEKLHALFGVKHELQDGFSWAFLHRSDIDSDFSPSEVSREIECNSKLAVAMFVMDECFLPLLDHRSGTNLLHNIVYSFGSNFNRLNYTGFFTAILERGDEIVAAASIRIHGNQLAEMPFIGTRYMYRRQGMCRRLLNAIEHALCSLNVEKLVIPAISELSETWTSVFGFKPLEASSKRKMKNMNLLVFPRVDMLQKSLLKNPDGSWNSELKEDQNMSKVAASSDQRCSLGFDLNVPGESDACSQKSNAGSSAAESCLQPLDCPCNGSSNVAEETVNDPESDKDIKCLAQICAACEMPDGIDKSILSPGDQVCNTHEQSETTDESYGAVSVPMVNERNGKSLSDDDNPAPFSDKINLDRPQELSLKASGENTVIRDCGSEATDFIASVNQNCHSSCGPSGDTGTGPGFSPCTDNGICTSAVVKSCLEIAVDNVCVPKVELSKDAISDDPKRNTKSSSDFGSHCQDGCTNVMQNSGSNSSSVSGVALHCASGGANSCGTEVIIV